MNENQRKLRRTAAREFMQALDQLEVMLQSEPSSSETGVESSQPISQKASLPQPAETRPDALAADQMLDEAAADIDSYIADGDQNSQSIGDTLITD